MRTDCSICLDTLSLVYLSLLFFNLKIPRKKSASYQYACMLGIICGLLITDIIYLSLYGSSDEFIRTVLFVDKNIYFICGTCLIWYWAKYVHYILYGEDFLNAKSLIINAVCLFVCILIIVLNVYTNCMFSILEQGTFMLTPVFIRIYTIANYVSAFFVTLIVIKYKNNMYKEIFIPLLIFPLFPFVAELINIFYYNGISLICAYVISALMVFHITQQCSNEKDALTGLFNRKHFEDKLAYMLSANKKRLVCGIIIDLDNLKTINDSYGHIAGDTALQDMAKIIKMLKYKNIYSIRYGGDEFILIWTIKPKENITIENVLLNLEKNKNEINKKKLAEEVIDFSHGEFCCPDDKKITAKEFIKEMDSKMYEAKKIKKNQ